MSCPITFPLHTPPALAKDWQANVFVDADCTPRISDFGLATLLTEVPDPFAGSVRWISPELLADSRTPRTRQNDIYAFAMTALVCVVFWIFKQANSL